MLVQAVVHDYPRWDDEGALHYVERLCILSGLIRSEDRAMIQPDETIADLKREELIATEKKKIRILDVSGLIRVGNLHD